ncbi:MAG: hypothetical protein EKK29_05910 [Hyphomicrobiales bacterium]|nr:MAG: hypothetical protein EKK29_05910 [Hyphomicrobiales bacterium]
MERIEADHYRADRLQVVDKDSRIVEPVIGFRIVHGTGVEAVTPKGVGIYGVIVTPDGRAFDGEAVFASLDSWEARLDGDVNDVEPV